MLKILSFFLIFSLQGCDFLYRLLDKEGAQEKDLIGEVILFQRNSVVVEIQTLLKIYGYKPGKIDGVLGPTTRKAIEEFQKDNDLKVTRFVDHKTWQKLTVFKENGFIQENQLNVRLIQEILEKAGFDSGEIDGEFGPNTQKAVEAFQKAHSLKVDGRIGYETLKKLADFITDESPDHKGAY